MLTINKGALNSFLFFFVCLIVGTDAQAFANESITQTHKPAYTAQQLNDEVIAPTLRYLGLDSPAARRLLVTTAAHETHLGMWLRALRGDAVGLYQMEPSTHDDIWDNFLRYRPKLAKKVRSLLLPFIPSEMQLVWNAPYATAMARIHYLRFKEKLPRASDIRGQANYWKKYYNTNMGRGTVKQFVVNYRRLVKPHVRKLQTNEPVAYTTVSKKRYYM